MSDVLARNRLTEERKALARDRPLGSWAKPFKKADGSIDLFKWYFGVKPKEDSIYALPDNGTFRIRVEFRETYPTSPPLCFFDPPIFHTNVWPGTGAVCLSLLLEPGHHPGAGHHGFWQAGRTFTDIINSLSVFLEDPNPSSVANADACTLFKRGKTEYAAEVRRNLASYPARLAAASKK
jgi:ubiquitin-conjugating enzyme E2 I